MSSQRPVTIHQLQQMKADGTPIAMLTCYDASFARAMDAAGVDTLLVGDSLGNVVQGRGYTLSVTVDEIAYHVRCVRRGARRPFLVADMPFGSFADGPVAMHSCAELLGAGASMVKLEGAGPMIEVVDYLYQRGVSVCGHLGLIPQSVHQLGGYRVQGRDAGGAERLKQDAAALQQAGAQMLVLECVPSGLATEITGTLDIPVIGIGAGAGCDGQVLVMHDMLGLNPNPPRFVRDFSDAGNGIQGMFEAYVEGVRARSFPAAEHGYD